MFCKQNLKFRFTYVNRIVITIRRCVFFYWKLFTIVLRYVICSQMAFMDEEVNSFFALLHLFTNEYVVHLLEDRRAGLKNVSTIQYALDTMAAS